MISRANHQFGAHAIVMGGSIAGLVAARVLSDWFTKVTVIERDPRPEGPEPRKGAPQMRHAHILLAGAIEPIREWYPGIIEELAEAGALRIDAGADVVINHYGAWKPRFVAGIPTIGCSRSLLEWHLRRRTEAISNIEILYEHVAENLVTNENRDSVTGVVVKGAGKETTVAADLVVDAAGRGTRAPRWLEALGYERPFEQEVKVELAYTSRMYERPDTVEGNWKALAIYSRLPGQRGAFVFEIEQKRWLVSFPGYFKDHCPTDEEGFLAFAKSLPVPDAYEAIRNAKPLTDPVVHKIPSSRWFRYDRMKRFPERFLVVGDSVVSLNPLYGQGMLVSIQGLRDVNALLAQRANENQGLNGFPLVAQKKIAAAVLPSWMLSTTMDLRHPKTMGDRPFGLGAAQRIFADLIDLTSVDPAACQVFYEMLHMVRGPEAILDRRVLFPLLGYTIKASFVPVEKRIRAGVMPPAP